LTGANIDPEQLAKTLSCQDMISPDGSIYQTQLPEALHISTGDSRPSQERLDTPVGPPLTAAQQNADPIHEMVVDHTDSNPSG
jgi:hypothetical protein